jgi:hypothetical protein
MQPGNTSVIINEFDRLVALNSLSGISLNATGGGGSPVDCKETRCSQFPFWDFFECNQPKFSPLYSLLEFFPLNSLSGISLNATLLRSLAYPEAITSPSLNSLSGISLNATPQIVADAVNYENMLTLSIPFLGFL